MSDPFSHGGATLVSELLAENPVRPANPEHPENLEHPENPAHLVMLHGWRATRDSLRDIGVLFQHSHQVHLLDLPGFGEAPPPPASWGTLEYADLVQQYLLERVKGPVVLVGHSFGSRVSVRIAARRLPQVQAVVLMSAPGLPADRVTPASLRRSAIRTLRKILVTLKGVTGEKPIQWHTERFGSTDYLAAGELKSVLVKTVNENLTESAQAVACPVLLLWGSDDDETPVWLGVRYKELMGDHATLVVLPHKDHHSIYQSTGAHLCAAKIRQFLGQAGQSAFAPDSPGASAQIGQAGQASQAGQA